MQAERQNTLPVPDAASAAHSAECAAFLREQIQAAGGSISFSRFMHHALYANGLGYYAAGATKFGIAGDFVTAPEVSPVFGRVLALQCAEVMSGVENASILEYGAGSGRLAVDVLGRLAELGTLPVRYRILEVSASLRERQEQTINAAIPELSACVEWIATPPTAHRGVVIANEVMDALPVERFAKRNETQQLCVECHGDDFGFLEKPAPALLGNAVAAIESDLGAPLAEGYISEVSIAAPAWTRDVVESIDTGFVFLFDYGLSRREYYAPDRSNGWLRCHFRHHAHDDPLILPGVQDMTTWVDFSAIATAAVEAGADIAGYVTQSHFLMGGGLDRELATLTELPGAEQVELSAAVKMLTLPGAMGENFKCMGLAIGSVSTPSAFQFADRTHTL